jgi:hypothetical protein
MVHLYFYDLSRKVHEAAARALCALYEHCLPKVSKEVVINFMYEPLNAILNTGNNIGA